MKFQTGTVISGTLRTDDLLRAFAQELNRHRPDDPLADWAFVLCSYGYDDPAEANDCLNQLFDALSIIAEPHGCYFGAHPGDGADFGFWENES